MKTKWKKQSNFILEISTFLNIDLCKENIFLIWLCPGRFSANNSCIDIGVGFESSQSSFPKKSIALFDCQKKVT